MKRGKKKDGSPILAALRRASNDEAEAVALLERLRWGDSPACPLCGSVAVYQMQARDGGRNKDCRWRCRDCKRMYSVRTGTVFQESRLPLSVWCFALWSACSSKKGVSALQISRECEISYKSSLYLLHRIRRAMAEIGPAKLSGEIEADETYVGGKPRYKGQSKRGRGTRKIPVFGVVERGGKVRYRVMERVTASTLKAAIREQVDLQSRLLTDQLAAYAGVGREFAHGHDRIEHDRQTYARGDIHTNTIEGAFSLIKRGVFGTYHSVSKKHLHRYLSEFEFRYNTRKMDDGQRVAAAVKWAEGKRLTYAEQVRG